MLGVWDKGVLVKLEERKRRISFVGRHSFRGDNNPLSTPSSLSQEKHGIGTDATHADHINTIKEREYVGVQQNGTFLPGKIGMGLVMGYDSMGVGMSKPDAR